MLQLLNSVLHFFLNPVNMNSTKIFSNVVQFSNGNAMFKRNLNYRKLKFDEFGNPLRVLKIEEGSLPAPVKNDEILVNFHLAPVNPSDINLIQGVYPVEVNLPGVGGIEGVGEVVDAGSDVSTLKPGDKVIPNVEALGTWRNYGIFKPEMLLKVPEDVNAIEIAGLSLNSCTAYRMLKDFVPLQVGDVVIQNGANSACGQNVIQMCRVNKFLSVNIVRERPEINKLKSYLHSLGANYVFTEKEFRTTSIFKENKIPKAKLGLNCVGGRSVMEISRQLADKGVVVTYGDMCRKPITIVSPALVFKGLSFRGYWMTEWNMNNKKSDERKEMIEKILDYMRSKELKVPKHKIIPLSNFAEAIMKTSSILGFEECKFYLDLNK